MPSEKKSRIIVVSMFLPVQVEKAPDVSKVPESISRKSSRKSFSLLNSSSGLGSEQVSLLDRLKQKNESLTSQRRRGTISSLHDRTDSAHLASKSFLKQTLSSEPFELNSIGQEDLNLIIEPAQAGNIGLHNAIRSTAHDFEQICWLGTVGSKTDSYDEKTKTELQKTLINRHNCVPVYVSDVQLEDHYNKFCKQALWPIFHYILPEYPKSLGFEKDVIQNCMLFNEMFAKKIKETYKKGDIIWINDYHLIFLPKYVREFIPDAKIGFFLHVPFPSSEVFRCLHVRKQVLESMLCADLIGFQTFSFARHFQNTCSRVLSCETSPKGIQHNGRFVSIGIFPIGIDLKAFNEKREDDEVKLRIKKLEANFKDKFIVLARDKLDYVKGVRCKLLAFEKFLIKYPEFVGKAMLIQVALSSVTDKKLRNEITSVAARVNAKFGTLEYQPIMFLYQDISFKEYLAMLTVADAFLITSLRDGMNLTSHEYVVCQEKKKSPLIISEFAGTYGSFGVGTIRINPWNHTEVADAIYKSLKMSKAEKENNWEIIYENIKNSTAQNWVNSFVSEINNIYSETPMKKAHRFLDDKVTKVYRESNKKLIMFNLSGVLVPFTNKIDADVEHDIQKMKNVLYKLIKNVKNTIYIFSGNTRERLDKIFGDMNIGLCAENGLYLKHKGSNDWIKTYKDCDASWEENLKKILEFYTERTPGAYIEQKEGSLVWHYRNADNLSYASWQASECQNHIKDTLVKTYNITVLHNNRAVEVTPYKINKVEQVSNTINKIDPDFILYIGVDSSDEKVYQNIGHKPKTICCNTGPNASKAQYFVNSYLQVIDFLEKLENN